MNQTPRELKDILDQQALITTLIGQLDIDSHRLAATEEDVKAHVEQLKAQHEPFALMPQAHHAKVVQQLTSEWKPPRALAAGESRFRLEPLIGKFESAVKTFVAQRRRDVTLSAPSALDHVDANGLLLMSLLREARAERIAKMSVQQLHQTYEAALARQDAAALIDLELVEDRVARGGLSTSPDDLPAARELHEHVAGVQELREPIELAEVPDIIESARKAITKAQRRGIAPVNPLAMGPDAVAAIEEERARQLARAGA